MPLVAAAENYMLNQWGSNQALFASLHTAYSATGTNELVGGSYARLAITWGGASGGVLSLSGTPYTFNVPATTVAWVGFWTLVSSGTFQGMAPAGGASPFTFAVPSSTGVLLAPGSGYSANQQVVVFPTAGSTLPGGLTAGTIYYAVSVSGDSFSLSATSGGGAITISADGSGTVQAITPEVFAGPGTYAVSSGSWTLT